MLHGTASSSAWQKNASLSQSHPAVSVHDDSENFTPQALVVVVDPSCVVVVVVFAVVEVLVDVVEVVVLAVVVLPGASSLHWKRSDTHVHRGVGQLSCEKCLLHGTISPMGWHRKASAAHSQRSVGHSFDMTYLSHGISCPSVLHRKRDPTHSQA